MVGSFVRLAAAPLFAGALAGCGPAPEAQFSDAGNRSNYGAKIENPDMPLQCVPYARAHSGVGALRRCLHLVGPGRRALCPRGSPDWAR